MAKTKWKYDSNVSNVLIELGKVKENALESIGEYAQGEAKTNAPVGQYDDGRVGGRLRKSIDYKVKSENEVHIGTDVEYAGYVEKGTSKSEAQPYLTPAVEGNQRNLKKLAEQAYKNMS